MDDQPNVTRRKPFGFRPLHSFSLRSLLLFVTILATLIWAFGRLGETIEDGWLDVEMRYQVVDAATGRALPGATVDFVEDVVKAGRLEPVVTMSKTTDADGIAARVCKDSGCSWRTSGLGWSTRFSAGGGVPWALQHARPPATSRPASSTPNTREYDWRSEYLGHGKEARATIRVPLEQLAQPQTENGEKLEKRGNGRETRDRLDIRRSWPVSAPRGQAPWPQNWLVSARARPVVVFLRPPGLSRRGHH